MIDLPGLNVALAVHPAEFEAWIVKLTAPDKLKISAGGVWGNSQFTVVWIAVVFTDSVPFSTAPEGNLK